MLVRDQVCKGLADLRVRFDSEHQLSLGRCPPCFNCMLPAFTCGQYGSCNRYNGQCECPPGWAGIDCLTPRMFLVLTCHTYVSIFLECDSLADGNRRRPREEGESCKCKDGWGGINCNGAPMSSAQLTTSF